MSKIDHSALLEMLGLASVSGARALVLLNRRLSNCLSQLTSAIHVLALILKGNRLQVSDLNILPSFSRLQWLDLSSNQIKELPRSEVWAQLQELQILYLHENLLSDWEAIKPLEYLPGILHITLFNNPIVHLLGYRHYMVSEIQTLIVLDFYVVTDEERLSDVSYSSHFKTLTDITKFPLQEAESNVEEELLGLYTRTIYKMKRKYERCSAVIRIQSLWRGYTVRKNLGGFVGKRDQAATMIQRHVRGFLLRRKLKRDLEALLKTANKQFLLFEPEEYVKYLAVQKIEAFMISRVLKKKREVRNKEGVAITIQKYVRRWLVQRRPLPLSSNTIYFFRHQTGTFLSILRAVTHYNPSSYHPMRLIAEVHFPDFFKSLKVERENEQFAAMADRIGACEDVKVLRFPDLDSLKCHKAMAVHFTSWMNDAKLNFEPAKAISKETKVSEKYSGYRMYQRQLAKIKTRESKLTFAQRTKLEQLLSSTQFDDYHDLMTFTAPSNTLLWKILKVAQQYNALASKHEFPLFMPLLQQCAAKVASACLLQSYWRGKVSETSPGLAHYITAKRAILCIQRWWKSLRLTKRLFFLSSLHSHLSTISSPTLYIEEHTFACLNSINDSMKTALKFAESSLFFKPMSGDVGVARNWDRTVPEWLDLHFPTFKLEAGFAEEQLDYLLKYGTDCEKTVLHKVTSKKSYLSDAELSLIALTYPNVEAAKRRCAMLFFKTANIKHHLALKLFTRENLEDDFLMPKLKKQWKVFKVDTLKLAKLRETAHPVIIRPPSPEAEPAPPTPPKVKVDLEVIVKEIEENQSRGESAITSRELAQWRVKKAHEEAQRKQHEAKSARELELSHVLEQKQEEKERLAISLSERSKEIRKELDLRRRLRSKEADVTSRIREEREFVRSFALNCNMLSNQIVKSQITRVRRKVLKEKSLFVKEFKERRAKEREIQESITYERFKSKQANKDKTTPFVL